MDIVYTNTVRRSAETGSVVNSVSTVLINGSSARCRLQVSKLEGGILERHNLRRGGYIPFHYWR